MGKGKFSAMLGNGIAAWRMSREMTQKMLAEAADLSVSTLIKIEAGINYNSASLDKLLDYMNVDPLELLCNDGLHVFKNRTVAMMTIYDHSPDKNCLDRIRTFVNDLLDKTS